MKLRFCWFGLAFCFLLGTLCEAAQMRQPQGRRPVSRAFPVAVTTPAPAAPAIALRPEQMPATPPEIAFRNGVLTITAQNSTLGDILRAVRNQTGAAVDVPGNATERVVGRFGPGPARDVLSSLLNGSHYNYVLLGSATNPDALEQVIITTKTNESERPVEQASAEPVAAAQTPPAPAAAPDGFGGFGDDAEATQDSAENIFGTDDQNGQGDDQQPNPFGQQANDVRTPEQMLQDLQRQQQANQGGLLGGQPPQNPPVSPGQPFRGFPNPRGGVPSQPQPEPNPN